MDNKLSEHESKNENETHQVNVKAAELDALAEPGTAEAPESGDPEAEKPEQAVSASDAVGDTSKEATEDEGEAASEADRDEDTPEGRETKPAADTPADENDGGAPAEAQAAIELPELEGGTGPL